MIPKDKILLRRISETLIRFGIEAYDIAEEGPVVFIRTIPAPSADLQASLVNQLKDHGLRLRAGELPEDWNKSYPAPIDVMARAAYKNELTTYRTGGPMTKQEYMDFHKACCDKMMSITKAKNSDYTGESGDPFANFAQIGMLVQAPSIVEIGFITRMSDKLSRIGSFITKGTLQVKDESVEDTLLDLANYCLLFAGYLRSRKGASK